MKLSREAEERMAENRLKKLKNDADNKKCFWSFVILGCIIFATSFFAGARSTMMDGAAGTGIFYAAMEAGVLQILLGIGVIVIGFVNYRRSPAGGMCCIGICLFLLIFYFLHLQMNIATINIILLLGVLALCAWAQVIMHREEALKTEEGYPLFSPEASYAGEYELPPDVRLRQQAASRAMGTVGPPAAPPVPAAPEQETEAAAAFLFSGKDVRLPDEVRIPDVKLRGFGTEYGRADAAQTDPGITPEAHLTDMTAVPSHAVQKSNASMLPDAAAVQAELQAANQIQTLNSIGAMPESFAQAADGIPKTGVAALPKVSAEELLMDMTAVPSHAVKKGDASQLPDPAEVRARMAAMKQARDEREAAMRLAEQEHPPV